MDYVKANTFGYILIQYKSEENVYRAMYVPLKKSTNSMIRVNTHLICQMTCLVSTLTHSLNTVPFITRVSRVLVLAQGVSQMAPNCLFNSRHFCT